MDKEDLGIPILKDYNNTLKSEKEGTPPSKRGEDHKDLNEVKASIPPYKIYQIMIGLLVFACLIMFLALFLGSREGNTCLANSFTYGAKKLSSEETGDLTCTCSFGNPKYAPFFFNKEEIIVQDGGMAADLPPSFNITILE